MSIGEAEARALTPEQPSSLGRDALDRFKHNKAALAGVVLIVLLIIMAVFAPLIAPYGPQEQVGPLDSSSPAGPSGITGWDWTNRVATSSRALSTAHDYRCSSVSCRLPSV